MTAPEDPKQPINGEHWLRAKELLADLSEVPQHARADWIEKACAGDPGLKAELERLLALDAEANRYFDDLGATLAGVDAAPEQIGVYRIVGEIGRGGMGTVYLGERSDGQFEQTVAIKVVGDSVNERMLERFREERRILAQLNHPGIAHLLDGDSLPDGRPYFIMEYIRGRQITDHADHERMDTSARLALFREVCAAVAHAHRNLVIHRDLKPGNVMVQEGDDGQPSIKLLDFGIARVMEGGPGNGQETRPPRPPGSSAAPLPAHAMAARATTEYGERLLTPRYAAPEQLRGEKATTSSDVYALGLLLHELLTGTHPFGAGISTAEEMQRAILEGSPARPSRTASRMDVGTAACRASTPRNLARRLRGDLDSIVLKAIQPEPEHRYASVGQLADDIRRHLDGEAVTARQGTAAYHAGVFLRRYRYGVAATVVVLAASIALGSLHLGRITHERNLARTEAAKAQQVSELLVSMLESANPEQARGEEISVREVLDQASNRINAELANQPDVHARMEAIIGTVYTSLGKYDKADTALTRALDLQRNRHGPDHPEALDTMQAMATLAMERGKNDEAETLLREVLARRLEQPRPDPMLVTSAQNDLGWSLARQGKHEEAEELHRAALATASNTPGATPEALLGSRNNLAVLLVGKGDFDEAEKLYRQVLAQQRERGPIHPDLATTLNNLGVLLSKRQRFKEAEPPLREAVAMNRKLFGDEHRAVALSMTQLANVLTGQERYDEAESLYLDALAMRRATLEPGHPHIATNLNSLAGLYRKQQDYARAEPLYLEAIAICSESMGAEHRWTADMIRNLGEMYLLAGKASAAEERLREALRIRLKNLPGDHWQVADAQSLLGAALTKQGNLDAAEPLLNAGYTALKQARGEQDRYTREAHERLARWREARDANA